MDKFWTNVWVIVVALLIFLAILWLIGLIATAVTGSSIKTIKVT